MGGAASLRCEPMGISECTPRRAPPPAVTLGTPRSSSAVWDDRRFLQSREHQHLSTAARLETTTIHPDARAETQTGVSLTPAPPPSLPAPPPASVLPRRRLDVLLWVGVRGCRGTLVKRDDNIVFMDQGSCISFSKGTFFSIPFLY